MTAKGDQAAQDIRRALELLARSFNPPHAPVATPVRLAELSGTGGEGIDLKNADLSHAWLRGIDFGDSRLGDLSHSVLDAAVLDACELTPEALVHARLLGTKLPAGFEPPPSALTKLPPVPTAPVLPLGHASALTAVAFSPDGRLLVSGSRDKTLHFRDPASGQSLRILKGHGASIRSLAFSPDGRLLASASDDRIPRLWDPASGRLLRTLEGHRDAVNSVAFSPDGTRLASASGDNSLCLWDPASGRLLRTLAGHQDGVNSVAFSPDSTQLASASGDNNLRLWDATSGRLLRTLAGHRGGVNSVAFSPDGARLASASDDNDLRLWDSISGRPLHTLPGHQGPVTAVAFSPDGILLASTSADRTLRLWDSTFGRPLPTLPGHRGPGTAVAFSSDGALLASASYDGTIRLWDPEEGVCLRLIASLQDDAVMPADAAGLYFSRDDGRPWRTLSVAGFPRPLPADPLLERLTGFVTEGGWVLPIYSYPDHFRWDEDANPRILILPWRGCRKNSGVSCRPAEFEPQRTRVVF